MNRSVKQPYLGTKNETCDLNHGYKNNCTNNDKQQVRCRLCATCKEGWKRAGSGTRCQECPPSIIQQTNKI